ncbi:cobalt ECF transporter T component CbiQ [Thermocoleostomius sinensis]|uniref:Cobalt ECF transporter T component CbiQ n=1 Tax=Thermocoleostomius sinensis A174 TaxID=2016057 RepID=A0A9E8Z8B3_9CYAN|nr:cobalt ECF transporter T component CbiQ [Thermocoleostomius sinensis]WAL58344.1 cobalt ECF transporter T component CbiQ [Thermocoleostomius sinensis A174]
MRLELDEYAHLKSWLHQWEPRCKLIGLMAIMFAFAFVETLQLIPFMLAVTGLLYALSRLPLTFWSTRIRYPGLFLLGVVALLPFMSGQTVIWNWGLLTLRQEGVMAVILIASRFLSIITVSLILFGTTPFLTIVKTMRSLGLPTILADMLLLSYRYLFEIAERLTQMRRSMRLRGFQSQRKQRWLFPHWQDLNRFASSTGTLLVRSYEQAERIYKAMRLRGYGNQSPQQQNFIPPAQSVAKARFAHPWSVVGLVLSLVVAISFVVTEVIL